MLKKSMKRFIINLIIFIVLFMPFSAFGQEDEPLDEFEIRPKYIFKNKGQRDPFEPRHKRESVMAMAEVDISTFVLLGITDNGNLKAGLFRSKSGSEFGYIFIDGRLYGDNDQVVPDVAGEIRSENEVILRQGDREMLFKLAEGAEGMNIRPKE